MAQPTERFDSRTATWIPLHPSAQPSNVAEASAAGDSKPARSVRQSGGRFVRMYHAADTGRLGHRWASSDSSADSELLSSLAKLRGRSRALIRDAAYAARAQFIVTNNVVGDGIGLQAQVKKPRGKLDEVVNADIERAWSEWSRADCCHTGGMLHFADLERVLMGEVFEAGEVIIRKHYTRFGASAVPFALEIIEPERLADQYSVPAVRPGNEMRMGVEVDRFQRPVAYWIRERHPGDQRATPQAIDRLERVPADQIRHLFVVKRWPQGRGEPWMHAVVRRINDMDGYSENEIIAARGASAYMAFIKTPDNTPLTQDQQAEEDADNGERTIELAPGVIEQLPPGWDIVMNNPNRPNPNMDPFMRMMLREVAAGIGVSYESLSRDYSQSNYSSSRLALLDDRDLWRVLQGWFIRQFRAELHRDWLRQAVLSRAVPSISVEEYASDPSRFEGVRFKPRGWGWIDPTKEVQAYRLAVRCGFTTVGDVIAATGGGQDLEDVLEARERELQLMSDKGLEFETDIANDANQQQPASPAAPANGGEGEGEGEGENQGEGAAKSRAAVVPLKGQAHG